jgi:formylglycine-generating enzyme required for sulfatase activity
MEQNGTFDMMGNEWEWTETKTDSYRTIRGASYGIGTEVSSSLESYLVPTTEYRHVGFRIASIPEPTTICLFALTGLLIRNKK